MQLSASTTSTQFRTGEPDIQDMLMYRYISMSLHNLILLYVQPQADLLMNASHQHGSSSNKSPPGLMATQTPASMLAYPDMLLAADTYITCIPQSAASIPAHHLTSQAVTGTSQAFLWVS